jgi:hypothetical protein
MADPITEQTVIPLNSAVAEAIREGVDADADQIQSAPEQNRSAGDPVNSPPDRRVEPQAKDPQQRDTQPPYAQQPYRLKDIQIGKPDGRGLPITYIYAVQSDEYAIYQAGEAMVHFADDPGKAQVQRKSMLPLSSARAEVNALAQGLPYREVCDRQLAYALQLALDGDMDGAKGTVAAAKAFVLAKRAARGRFQYLKWSYGTAAVLIGLLFVASRFYPLQPASSDLWLAAKAGLIGAAFSIALAIRGRTVALDIDLLDKFAGLQLRHTRAAPPSALTLEFQIAEPVLSFLRRDLKGDRPLAAVETAVDDRQHTAGTIRNHDLGFWF